MGSGRTFLRHLIVAVRRHRCTSRGPGPCCSQLRTQVGAFNANEPYTPRPLTARPKVRLPDRTEALLALYPRDGRGGLRYPTRVVREDRRDPVQELGTRADLGFLLRRGMDAAHRWGPIHPDRGHHPTASREYGSP